MYFFCLLLQLQLSYCCYDPLKNSKLICQIYKDNKGFFHVKMPFINESWKKKIKPKVKKIKNASIIEFESIS